MVYPNDNIVNAILLLLGIALKEMLKTSYCFLRVVSCFSIGENGVVNVTVQFSQDLSSVLDPKGNGDACLHLCSLLGRRM